MCCWPQDCLDTLAGRIGQTTGKMTLGRLAMSVRILEEASRGPGGKPFQVIRNSRKSPFFLVHGRVCLAAFFARLSHALARTPVLALFAAFLGAGPEAIGFAVAMSTITGNLLGAPLDGFLLTLLAGSNPPQLVNFHVVYGVVAALGLISWLAAFLVLRGYRQAP